LAKSGAFSEIPPPQEMLFSRGAAYPIARKLPDAGQGGSQLRVFHWAVR